MLNNTQLVLETHRSIAETEEDFLFLMYLLNLLLVKNDVCTCLHCDETWRDSNSHKDVMESRFQNSQCNNILIFKVVKKIFKLQYKSQRLISSAKFVSKIYFWKTIYRHLAF